MKENLYTPDCIRTQSGIYFNVLAPTSDMICIEDIAHSLSMQPRFGGHLNTFYSVAQHSYMVSKFMAAKHALAGLLHDASEAYLMDIPSPIKQHLTNYKEMEDRIMGLIATKFGFQYPLHPEVKQMDGIMLETEWEFFVLNNPDKRIATFRDHGQPEAKLLFLKQFEKLTKGK